MADDKTSKKTASKSRKATLEELEPYLTHFSSCDLEDERITNAVCSCGLDELKG